MEMPELYKQELAKIKALGIVVLVVPGPKGQVPSGQAFVDSPRIPVERHITIKGPVDSPLWLFVLLHELGHHVYRHTDRWTSIPAWVDELTADRFALSLIRRIQPDAYEICERASKAHIRRYLQPRIDAEMWYGTDLDTAEWAGCRVSRKARRHMLEWD